MSDLDQLNQRLDRLEKMVTERLDALEKIVRSNIPDAVLDEPDTTAVEPPVQPVDQIAIRQNLASITAANTAVATEEPALSTPPPEPAVASPKPPAETPQWIKNVTDIEWLTSRIGITLLLIGIITLFLWLNEKSWVTDTMRLTAGYSIGAALLGLGIWLTRQRADFGQLLAGGGIATFYITTFVGHFFLEAIPSGLTLIIVLAISALAYGIATWKRQAVFAYIGLVFGLIAPFTLLPSDASIAPLTAYACLIVGGAVAVFYTLRWHYLMLTAAAGGWFYMVFLTSATLSYSDQVFDQIAVQAGVLFNLAAFGLLTLWLVIQDRRSLDPTTLGIEPETDEAEPTSIYSQIHWTLVGGITSSPILAAAISLTLWPDMTPWLWAVLMIVSAHLYIGLGVWMARDGRFAILELPLYIAGGLLLLFSIPQSASNLAAPLLILFSIEAAVFTLYANRQQRGEIMLVSHLFTVTAVLIWFGLIMPDTITDPFLNLNFYASLLLVASVGTIAWHATQKPVKYIYQFAAHLLVLPVTGLELNAAFPDDTYWMLLHIIIHSAVFFIGVHRENPILRYQAAAFMLLSLTAQLILDIVEFLTWPDLILVLIAGQLFAVNFIAKQKKDGLLKAAGLIFALAILPSFVVRLSLGNFVTPFLNLPALSTLCVIGALFVIAMWYSDRPFSTYIGVVTHFLVLGWLAMQAQEFTNVQATISALWAVYSIALLLVGLWLDLNVMRRLGIGTILLTVGKLFLVDLENVATGIRVLLFSGFGGVLLVISYFSGRLGRPSEPEDTTSDDLEAAIEIEGE